MDIKKKNYRFKALSCVLLVLAILLIPSISAFEFDNVKSYDPITRIATINNCAFWIGTCLIEGRQLAELQLVTPLNVFVSRGDDKLVGEFTFRSTEDVANAFKDLYLTDLKNGKSISRGQQFKYKQYKEISVDDYETICKDELSLNGTSIQVCNKVEIGKHMETQVEWIPISNPNNEFIKGVVYNIGVFVDVEEGDHGDWRPKVLGVEIGEWAEWTESLEVDLISYYSFEETVGEVVDEMGNYDGVNNGAVRGVIGKVNNAFNYTAVNTDYVEASTSLSDEDFSFSIWVKAKTIAGGAPHVFRFSNTADADTSIVLVISGGNWEWRMYGDGGGADIVISTGAVGDVGSWQHFVGAYYETSNNMSFYKNGIFADSTIYTKGTFTVNKLIIGSNIPTLNNWDGSIDEFATWGRRISQAEITQLYNEEAGIGFGVPIENYPNIILNSPSSANYTTTQNIIMNFTAWDDINLTDVKLYINSFLNQTNASGINNTDYLFDLNLGDGDYIIYGKATDNSSQENSTSTIRIVIDSTAPTITSAYNLTDLVTSTLPINSTWHYNASDLHIDKCYYNSTENTTQTVVTCNTTINTAWTTRGNKTITFCANDTFGLESCNTEYAYIYYIQETQADNPDPITESFDATFNFTVNLTNIPTTTATLILNNTVYSPTTTTAGADGYYFEVIVTIPDGWGNTTGIIQDWLWSYTINGVIVDQNTSTDNITVYELGIDDCSSYGEIIFDFSVLDEGTLVEANESLTIDVEADLTLTSKSDATQYITYNNTWSDDNNPQICIPNGVINNSQYWIDLTVGFSSTDHVWEFYYMDSGTLNSTKIYENFNGQTNQNINLMDLLTADSTSFLFNYFDADGLAVDGAVVHIMRKYIGSGLFREVERAKQDQNGDTIVHLVEEDVIYYFIITLEGVLLHVSSEYTALCQATPCTIQIEASIGSAIFPTDWDLMDGGAYTITSSASTRKIILTYTNNVSTDMNFTAYRYESDGSYTVVETGNDTGTSGSITLTIPQVAGNVSFFATVTQDNSFVNSKWINFESNARDQFGTTLALFLGALIILTLGLFAVSEGVGTIVYVILGVVISGALGLIITDLSTGVNIVVYLVLAGGILLWKLTGSRK